MSRFSRAFAAISVPLLACSAFRTAGAQSTATLIDPAHFRGELAARALFEESNRQRVAAGVPALAPLRAAETAALWQAQFMAQTGTIGHVNTLDRNRRNLDDRVRAAGANFRYIAENVAMNFAIDYEPHRPFYTRPGPPGDVIYSYVPFGPPLPYHTYAGLARTFVAQWLASPAHRKNLLSPEAQYLGCAAVPGARDRSHGLGNIYCAQVFIATR